MLDSVDFCVLDNGWFVKPVNEVHDTEGAADKATLLFEVDVNKDVGAEENFFDPFFAVRPLFFALRGRAVGFDAYVF